MKKTYGINGLMEWHAVFRHGGATLTARFSGGALTGYGVTPAEYTTSNPVAQHIIENSPQFRDGRIRLLRSGQAPSSGCSGSSGSSGNSTPPATLAEKEFPDSSLAREWLIENFGADPRQLVTQKGIRDFGVAHGIRLRWK